MSIFGKKLPVVLIVGRPNVGKSSLFNRIIRKRMAVVDDEPGITRDRHFTTTEWNGKQFILVDTGGLVGDPKTEIELGITRIVESTIDYADIILFMVENTIVPQDFEIAGLLRKFKIPIIVAANKIDNPEDVWSAAEAEKLSVGTVVSVSAKFGLGFGDLLDVITNALPTQVIEEDEKITKIAIVGRPNVGKSSYANALLGREVSLVHEKPGTTRDPVNTRFSYFNDEYELVDTAGLFRKQSDVEYFAALRTYTAIQECDIAVLIVDATEDFTRQDKRISADIAEKMKPFIIAINKWDLIPEKNSNSTKEFEEKLRLSAPFLEYVPVVFISAKTNMRVQKTLDCIKNIKDHAAQRVQTSKFNELVQFLQEKFPPPIYRGKRPKILYGTQTAINPPEFVFFTRLSSDLSPSYRKYITNQIRERFGFEGVPFKLVFRDRD
jgi:GTPase